MRRFNNIPLKRIIAAWFLVLVFTGPGFTGTPEAADSFPERIVLNLTQTPHLSQAVTWRSEEKGDAPAAQIVPVSLLLEAESHAVTVKADTCQIEIDESQDAFHHSVVFESLVPGTEYAYRVGNDPHWSEWSRFKTASSRNDPFRFVFFGDIQEQVAALGSQLFRLAVMAVPDAAFWLFAGDMMDNGPDDREWAGFLRRFPGCRKPFPCCRCRGIMNIRISGSSQEMNDGSPRCGGPISRCRTMARRVLKKPCIRFLTRECASSCSMAMSRWMPWLNGWKPCFPGTPPTGSLSLFISRCTLFLPVGMSPGSRKCWCRFLTGLPWIWCSRAMIMDTPAPKP